MAWMNMGSSLLLRRHLWGLCWLSSHHSGGAVLASAASWHRLIPNLAELPSSTFFFFFFCLRVLYFFMSVLFTWVLGLVTITISTITLRSVFVLLILQGFSSWTLSQLSNSSSVKLSQGHPVLLHHQISPWAKDS